MSAQRPLCSVATSSVDGTGAIAASLATLIRAGDLLVLSGDLGAGKTAFTQSLGKALGVKTPITSPTFTLANRYSGTDLTVNHLDVYRLSHIDEVRDLGLHELVDDLSVTIIEWGDAIAGALPCGYLEICFLLGSDPDERRLEFRTVGDGWSDREVPLLALEVSTTSPGPKGHKWTNEC